MPIKIDMSKIPDAEMQVLCRTFLDAAKRFYEDPKNLEAFNAWKKAKESTVRR